MASSLPNTSQQPPQPPHLRRTNRSSQLIVNGEPFLVLGAELHNSTLSNAAFFSSWLPRLKAMNINTVLGAVSWAMIEPVEGEFNFVELDKCILAAREQGFHLVLLWFGSYKNAMSAYPPEWVQRDNQRFPRMQLRQAGAVLKTVNVIQPFCDAAKNADAKAFAALMRHLKKIDSAHSTVIMVQVENEVGLMGDSRDGSLTATRLYQSPVPEGLLEHLSSKCDRLHPTFQQKFGSIKGKSGPLSWVQAFGPGPLTEDLFMADAFSRYVQCVAAAGRAEYDIPLYMNVALCSEDPSWQDFGYIPPDVPLGNRPGEYPSGGPVGHNLDVYRYNAPDIHFYAPDIYLQNYEIISECFRHDNLPLFVPEQRRDEYGARRIWPAYGTQLAIGCSPFGIDSLLPHEASPFTLHFGLLRDVRKYILDAQANRPDDIFGFYFDEAEQPQEKPWVKSFGDYEATVERVFSFGKKGEAAGMLIRQADGAFIAVGFGYQVVFQSTNPKSVFTGVLCVEEMEAQEDGSLQRARVFNGDETQHGRCLVMPPQEPDYDGFPIPFHIPARTMISRCSVFSLERPEEEI
ncbi:glycoside hydrolase superfamily [Aspergillus pseudoustus]|uniref:Glycoside hydrolase superfamily n=1 Tax=Aspergillus pseudoustus TaxID=1810923 RepID=A0ABR4JWC8_9EURO